MQGANNRNGTGVDSACRTGPSSAGVRCTFCRGAAAKRGCGCRHFTRCRVGRATVEGLGVWEGRCWSDGMGTIDRLV